MNDGVNNKTNIDWKGLSSFLIITFIITYAIEAALILGGFHIAPGMKSMGQYVVAIVMWVPALATVLTVKLVTREGPGILNIRFGGWRPYVAAGLIIPACFLLIYALTWGLGLGRPDWPMQYFQNLFVTAGMEPPPMPPVAAVWAALFFAALIPGPLINSLFAFGEELGWRGYLLPKLLPFGKPRAYLLLGIVWGLWHLPLVLVGFMYPGYPLAGALLIMALTTAFGVYLNELTLRYRSSVLAGWVHGVFNSQKFGVWALLFPDVDPLLGGFSGILGIAIWLILGIWESRGHVAR
jgi:membrane protease YdiL (CAAX protease family)